MYSNCVYLHIACVHCTVHYTVHCTIPVKSDGTRYFFLSNSSSFAFGALSTITCNVTWSSNCQISRYTYTLHTRYISRYTLHTTHCITQIHTSHYITQIHTSHCITQIHTSHHTTHFEMCDLRNTSRHCYYL